MRESYARSYCINCGQDLTSEEMGGLICFTCANDEAMREWIEDAEGEDQHGDTCPECGGSGVDKWESFRECEYCQGEGYVWW